MHKDVGLIIDKICRCCMCENENMHSMFNFEKGSEDSNRVPLSEMLIACASIEVNCENGLPNNMCDACEQKLIVAYEFRTLCQKSDTALRELTNSEKRDELNNEEAIEIQPDVHNDLFDEDDDIPLSRRNLKKKRGRPKKTDAEELNCTFCSKVLHSKTSLKVHLRTHAGEKLRQCLFCDAKYSRNNHLVRHLATHDKQGVQHPCEHCDKTFQLAAELFKHSKEHELIENDSEGIKIEADPAAVKTETLEVGEELQETRIGTSNNFQDDSVPVDDFFISDADDRDNDSDSEFITKKDVIDKSGEKTLYECKHCLKILTTYLGYKIHLRRHTGSGLVQCKVCNKSFTKQNHLSRHMITHGLSEEKPKPHRRSEGKAKVEIPCEYCDRKFKYRKSFKHHVKVEHGMSDVESDIEKLIGIDDNNKEKENQLEEARENISEALVTSIQNSWSNLKPKEPCDLLNGTPEEYTLEQTNISISEKVEPGEDVTFDETLENEDDEMEQPLTIDEQFIAKKSRSKNQVCHVCGATFARVNHLTRHMTLHRALLIHQCSRCEKAYSTEEHLKAHIEEEHINKPYVCTVCNKHFSRGEHLIRHLKVHQANNDKEENLKCSICELTFTRSDHLARHTKIHLLQDKRHVCVECGKAFNRLDNLKTHQRIHTGVKDTSKLHLCIYCGKEFNNSSNMIVHMRRHTGERPYKCNVCGKGFPRSHDLKCHERTHSGEKPYLCTLCGKSFNKSNKLLRHSRVHTGERPYVCNICGRAFTQSNDLALHMRRHTGARPYACGVCPARFIQSGQLKAHRRTTGHWMETQPDLKGGHRVEPVTPAHEPMPIKFKSQRYNDSRLKKEDTDQELPKPIILATPADPSADQSTITALTEVQAIPHQPQRILMGIMGNIKLPNESLIIDGSKLVELHTTGLVNLPSVIQTANGEEIKLKSEVGNFTIAQVEEVVAKNEGTGSYPDGTVIYSTVGHTSTTFTTSENFNFQNYH